jgi:aminomethyltransferase
MTRTSPLDAAHRALGAKIVPFGGWGMPLSYGEGTLAEHQACRTAAVVFDVSHLGTVRVAGPGALDLLQATLTNDLTKVGPGRAQYTHLLDPADASVRDDIIVWWLHDEVFDVMPNASNTDGVTAALAASGDVTLEDVTAERALLALQGPTARELLAPLGAEAAAVGRFRVGRATVAGVECTVAGTGYTGEDGVELAVPADQADTVWDALLAAGAQPAGLGARDTLRLEAGLPLHGHELGPGITPLQARLGWVVAWDKGDFPGRDALVAERDAGPARLLYGLATEGRRPPREGSSVRRGADGAGEEVGVVTSGNFSPTLGHGIALALLAPDLVEADELAIDLRGKPLPARIVPLPFVGRT